MLNTQVKQKIDTARNILVGKIPSPKGQIELISLALIYKSMSELDQKAVAIGGNPKYFIGEWEKYSWENLLKRELDNNQRMLLFIEAIEKMEQNPNLPDIFKNVFKNAYVPFKDGQILTLFLREIDWFTYEHMQDLGDAYEYLLNIWGTQKEAGQFRTPRHIIDFIVQVVDPNKNNKILDPACGSAGFLISAYKYIKQREWQKMTPEERQIFLNSFVGYDIDPTMVKIAQINMYLHGFRTPDIREYDTLTKDMYWNENYSVIFANPPFMSPKGGINPHNKFRIKAKRSEVLFVDYILEHLTSEGKAGIIVPEGIIFQSQKAYVALRKWLVEEGLLWAVVSLPSGVFQPYSGVKTSILFIDKKIAKEKDEILFYKIENDGFDLGAKRQPIDKNDLPQALKILKAYKNGKKLEDPKALWINKSKIAEDKEYNLTGDRYRQTQVFTNTKWPMVRLGEVAVLIRGVTYTKKDEVHKGGIKILRANNIDQLGGSLKFDEIRRIRINNKISPEKKLQKNDIFICLASGSKKHLGKVAFIDKNLDYYFGGFMGVIRTKSNNILPSYLFRVLRSDNFHTYITQKIAGVNINNLNSKILYNFLIPLPPLDYQKQLVEELDSYQKIIDGAKMIIDNWKPRIKIDPKWKRVRLGDIGRIRMCKRIFKKQTSPKGDIPFYKIGTFGGKADAFISRALFQEYKSKYPYPKKGDILLSTSGTIGKVVIFDGTPAYFQDSNIVWLEHDEKLVLNKFLYFVYLNISWDTTSGGTIKRLYNKNIENTVIPLPPLSVQKQIVAQIEKERKKIEEVKKLIEIYENKIKERVMEVWGGE